jgi:hypothetical protein
VLLPDALAGEGNAAEVDAALDVFEWLGKRARTVERRRIAQFRAGQLIAHQGSQPLAVEQMCKLVDDRGTPEGLRRYASTYIERGLARMDKPFDQVADECARRKCPCTYPLVASLAAYANATDDSTTTLLLLPTALEKFPLEPLAATWACSVVQAEEARGGKDAVTDRARYEQTYGGNARSAWKRKFPTADTQCKPPVPATTLDEIRRSLTRTVAACLAHRADPEPDETGVEIAFTVELNAAGRVTDSDAKYTDRAARECIQRKLWDARWPADARSPITGTFEVTWSR